MNDTIQIVNGVIKHYNLFDMLWICGSGMLLGYAIGWIRRGSHEIQRHGDQLRRDYKEQFKQINKIGKGH